MGAVNSIQVSLLFITSFILGAVLCKVLRAARPVGGWRAQGLSWMPVAGRAVWAPADVQGLHMPPQPPSFQTHRPLACRCAGPRRRRQGAAELASLRSAARHPLRGAAAAGRRGRHWQPRAGLVAAPGPRLLFCAAPPMERADGQPDAGALRGRALRCEDEPSGWPAA